MTQPVPASLSRVIVGTDFSWPSIESLRWLALELLPDAQLVLVHALEVPDAPAIVREPNAPDTAGEVATEGARRRLAALRLAIGRPDAPCIVRRGAPDVVLPAVAREQVADAIAVGPHRHRHGLWDRLGTTAERLLSQATVPVLLLPCVPDTRPTRVLVPMEDGTRPTEAVRWGRIVAQQIGARMTTVTVVGAAVPSHLLAPVHASPASAAGEWASFDPVAGRDRWIDDLLDAGTGELTAEHETCFGDAGEEIVATAERIGDCVIVMGRARAGAVRRAFLGSVTREVLRAAPCPVLVVPER